MNNFHPLSIAITLAVVVGAGWLAMRAIRWAKKGTKAGSMLAAAAFPFPDQPPPQAQVEQENRLKKNAESGDAND